MSLLLSFDRAAVTPDVERPAPELVLAGDPVHTTWMMEETEDLFSGYWQTTPGKWKVAYSEWEYIHILEGHSILTDEAGAATHLRAGDACVIRRGFAGTWECVETTLKEFVIKE